MIINCFYQNQKLQTPTKMQPQPQNKQIVSHKFQLQTTQRQAFLQIFNMYAKDGKINKKNLQDIFQRVGYYVSPQHFNELCAKVFDIYQQVNFQQFMQAFKVSNSEYDLRDIRNAFRLIAGDDDKYIPVEKIIDMFRKNDVEEERIKDLIEVLSRYIDQKKNTFDYELFLSHLRE